MQAQAYSGKNALCFFCKLKRLGRLMRRLDYLIEGFFD